jgi:hypothetical protein
MESGGLPADADSLDRAVEIGDLVGPTGANRSIHIDAKEAATEHADPRQRLALSLADERDERRPYLRPRGFVSRDHVEVALHAIAGRRDDDRLRDESAGVLIGHARRRQALPHVRPVSSKKTKNR